MLKSPCKDCEKHDTDFPGCIDDCEILKKLQSEHRRSFDYYINYNSLDSETYSIGS